MRQTLTIATASINTTPLDLDGNLALIRAAVNEAVQQQADLLLLPELALTGYGCEDMFFRLTGLPQCQIISISWLNHCRHR